MADFISRGNGTAIARVNGVREISRRLKSAREGFERMEKDLNRLLGFQPTLFTRACRLATSLIPVRRLQEWMNSMYDPLSMAESATRQHANDLCAGIQGLKKVTEEIWRDQDRISEVLARAEKEGWGPEQLFGFLLEEAEDGNLPIDAEVAELLQARQTRLSAEERAAFAHRMKVDLREYLQVVDELVKYVGTVGDGALELLGKVIAHYVAYAKLRPVVAELRDTGLAMTGASEGVFASRELLLRHLHASHEAFMVAADAADAMDRFRIAGPEMANMLHDSEGKLARRLTMLQAPRVTVKELPATTVKAEGA